jgi:hypothetical protein
MVIKIVRIIAILLTSIQRTKLQRILLKIGMILKNKCEKERYKQFIKKISKNFNNFNLDKNLAIYVPSGFNEYL